MQISWPLIKKKKRNFRNRNAHLYSELCCDSKWCLIFSETVYELKHCYQKFNYMYTGLCKVVWSSLASREEQTSLRFSSNHIAIAIELEEGKKTSSTFTIIDDDAFVWSSMLSFVINCTTLLKHSEAQISQMLSKHSLLNE